MAATSADAYVLSHFTDDSQNLHLSISDDGVRFEALAGGRPILTSAVGGGTMRDPFVGRAPDGLFHLVATDGWTSTSIVHASSPDLVHWTEPELVPLMHEVAGTVNAWAPEFFVSRSGVLRLIWSSVQVEGELPPDAETAVNWSEVAEPQRIWQATTDDFRTFGEPTVYYAPGFTVIDASAIVDDEVALLAFKDERGGNEPDSEYKDIHLVDLDDEGLPTGEARPAGTPHLVEGPAMYRVGDELRLVYDVFTTPDYGALASRDGLRWSPTELVVPTGTKHGNVFAVTAAEAAIVRDAFSA